MCVRYLRSRRVLTGPARASNLCNNYRLEYRFQIGNDRPGSRNVRKLSDLVWCLQKVQECFGSGLGCQMHVPRNRSCYPNTNKQSRVLELLDGGVGGVLGGVSRAG